MKREAGVSARDHYASFNRRMWAATIDSILIFVLIAPLFSFVFGRFFRNPDDIMLEFQKRAERDPALIQDVTLMWKALYESGFFNSWLVNSLAQVVVLSLVTAFFWKRWSSTPGKMLLKMKIVDAETEAPINNRQIVRRLLGYVVSTLGFLLGFIWISFNRKRQGWHDLMAGTVVIVVPRVIPDSAIDRLSNSREP